MAFVNSAFLGGGVSRILAIITLDPPEMSLSLSMLWLSFKLQKHVK